MVELRQTPVNDPEFALRVVNHDVVRFDVSVHDAVRMTKVQTLPETKQQTPISVRTVDASNGKAHGCPLGPRTINTSLM